MFLQLWEPEMVNFSPKHAAGISCSASKKESPTRCCVFSFLGSATISWKTSCFVENKKWICLDHALTFREFLPLFFLGWMKFWTKFLLLLIIEDVLFWRWPGQNWRAVRFQSTQLGSLDRHGTIHLLSYMELWWIFRFSRPRSQKENPQNEQLQYILYHGQWKACCWVVVNFWSWSVEGVGLGWEGKDFC